MTLRKTAMENAPLYYLLIIVVCLNIFEQGALCMLVLGLYFLTLCRFRFRFDTALGCMLVLSVCIMTAAIIFGWSLAECLKSLNFPLAYIIGRQGYILAEKKDVFVKRTCFAIFLGFFLQLLLQYLFNLGKKYRTARIMQSIWTHENIAVTLIGLLCAAIIGYSFYGIFLCKKRWMKIFCVISILLVVIVNLKTATRTPIALIILCYFVMAVVYCRENGKTKRINIIVGCLAVVLLFIAAVELNLFGLGKYLEGSAFADRFEKEGIETGRVDLFFRYFKLMPEHFWGGGEVSKIVGHSGHNYLQESGDMYGLAAFVTLAVFTVLLICVFVKLWKRKDKKDYHFLLFSMLFALFVQCCLEPVMTGYPIAFWMLLLIMGMANSELLQDDGGTELTGRLNPISGKAGE